MKVISSYNRIGLGTYISVLFRIEAFNTGSINVYCSLKKDQTNNFEHKENNEKSNILYNLIRKKYKNSKSIFYIKNIQG